MDLSEINQTKTDEELKTLKQDMLIKAAKSKSWEMIQMILKMPSDLDYKEAWADQFLKEVVNSSWQPPLGKEAKSLASELIKAKANPLAGLNDEPEKSWFRDSSGGKSIAYKLIELEEFDLLEQCILSPRFDKELALNDILNGRHSLSTIVAKEPKIIKLLMSMGLEADYKHKGHPWVFFCKDVESLKIFKDAGAKFVFDDMKLTLEEHFSHAVEKKDRLHMIQMVQESRRELREKTGSISAGEVKAFFDMAKTYSKRDMLKLAKTAGIDIKSIKDEHGDNVLATAFLFGNWKLASHLVELGMDPMDLNTDGVPIISYLFAHKPSACRKTKIQKADSLELLKSLESSWIGWRSKNDLTLPEELLATKRIKELKKKTQIESSYLDIESVATFIKKEPIDLHRPIFARLADIDSMWFSGYAFKSRKEESWYNKDGEHEVYGLINGFLRYDAEFKNYNSVYGYRARKDLSEMMDVLINGLGFKSYAEWDLAKAAGESNVPHTVLEKIIVTRFKEVLINKGDIVKKDGEIVKLNVARDVENTQDFIRGLCKKGWVLNSKAFMGEWSNQFKERFDYGAFEVADIFIGLASAQKELAGFLLLEAFSLIGVGESFSEFSVAKKFNEWCKRNQIEYVYPEEHKAFSMQLADSVLTSELWLDVEKAVMSQNLKITDKKSNSLRI